MILIDIHVWLFHCVGIRAFLLVTYTLPLLLVLTKVFKARRIKFFYFLAAAVLALVIGFLLDRFGMQNSVQMSEEQFERNNFIEKTRNLSYYLGGVVFICGLISGLGKTQKKYV